MIEILPLGNPSWKVGLLGLVAGRVSDEYQKPVFVWGKDVSGEFTRCSHDIGEKSMVDHV